MTARLRPWIPLDPSVDRLLEHFREQFAEVSFVGLKLRPRPFLHMKSQLFATAEAFRVYRLPEWAPAVQKHVEIRLRQVLGMRTPGITPDGIRSAAAADGDTLGSIVEAFRSEMNRLPPESRERAIFTFPTTGSHNQNPRSLLLDGEVLVAVSGPTCITTMIDFAFILCISEWPRDEEEFDRLFPSRGPAFYVRPFLRVLKAQS